MLILQLKRLPFLKKRCRSVLQVLMDDGFVLGNEAGARIELFVSSKAYRRFQMHVD